MIEQRDLKKSKTIKVLMTAIVAFVLVFVMRDFAFADDVPPEPQNGIPLVIVRIDESPEAIEAAEADSGKDYGTIAEMNSSEDHSVRCTGTVEIKVPAGYSGEYGSVEVPAGEVALDYIRGRGNSTWEIYGHTKKPYKIQFENEQDLFGMGINKEWALLANANDRTLLKNRIVSWLGEQMGINYAPQMIPVDVVMIGDESGTEELGSYCLSELVSKNRLSVDKAKLLAIYNAAQDEGDPFFTTDSGVNIKYVDPEKENQEIVDFINDLESSILEPETIEEEEHNAIAEKMDLESAAKYWWIQEFVCNHDAYETSSTYMHIDTNGGAASGWKLFWGPLWDFDLTLLDTDGSEEEGTKYGFNVTGMSWFDRLRDSDPLFDEILVQQWERLNPLLTELTEEGGKLDKMESEISDSWARDNEIWEDYYYPVEDGRIEFEAEVEKARNWIVKRQEWINANIGLIGKVYHTVTYTADGNVISTETVREGSSAEAEVEAPDKDGYLFVRWEDRESGDDLSGINVKEDLTVDAVYIRQEDAVKPEKMFFSRYEDWVPLDDKTYLGVDTRVYPEDAIVTSIKWASSDESVATVNKRGEVDLLSAGNVEITATLYNGVSKSFILHIYDPDEASSQLPEGVSAKPLTLKVGETEQIRYSLLPEGGIYPGCSIWYEFEGTDCIEIDELMGIVTAVKPGTVNVTLRLSTPDENVELTNQCVVTVTAEKNSIAGAQVVLSQESFIYNGKVRKPSIKTIGGKSLKAGTDYTVKWSNPKSKSVGTYTVTIEGKDKYSGTTNAKYKIRPKGTTLKKAKAAKRAVIVKWKRQAAKMAVSRITGYQIQLATDKKFTKNKKTKTVKGYKKVSRKVTKLKAKKKYYVRIRTYKTVSGVRHYSSWSKVRTVRTR